MATGVNVFESRELQQTLLALKVLPKELTKQTRKFTKQLVDKEWKAGLAKNATSPIQRAVLVRTAVSSVTPTNVTLKSATKGKTSEGTPSQVLASGAEFGMNQKLYSRYTRRSPRGKAHTVTRRVGRGFGWHRGREGRVVFPTAQDIAPRVAAIYVQTLLRTTAEAFEEGA